MIYMGRDFKILLYFLLGWLMSWLLLEPIKYRGKNSF